MTVSYFYLICQTKLRTNCVLYKRDIPINGSFILVSVVDITELDVSDSVEHVVVVGVVIPEITCII